jgi:hypothetical protein
MVTKRTNPRNAQLGDRDGDALTTRYGRQSVDKLEIMSDILEPVATSGRYSGTQGVKRTDIILKTAKGAPEIAFFKVQTRVLTAGVSRVSWFCAKLG